MATVTAHLIIWITVALGSTGPATTALPLGSTGPATTIPGATAPSSPLGTRGGTRGFFLDCHCEDCVPAEGLPRGRYWILSRPILRGSSDDFPAVAGAFRQQVASRFPSAAGLTGTVVLRHRPHIAAARRTRQAVVERRSAQGYRVLEIEFHGTDPSLSREHPHE